jgi:hypothetical protein
MKLIATMMLSLDGVYQVPGGPDEDRRGGFDRGGWAATHSDKEKQYKEELRWERFACTNSSRSTV